jgi:hypothetical protein
MMRLLVMLLLLLLLLLFMVRTTGTIMWTDPICGMVEACSIMTRG